MMSILVGILIGAALAAVISIWLAREGKRRLLAESEQLRAQAQQEAEIIRKNAEVEAKEALARGQQAAEREIRARRTELERDAERARRQDEILGRKNEEVDRKERDLKTLEQQLERREKAAEANSTQAQEALTEAKRKLERLAAMTQEQARKELAAQLMEDAKRDAAAEILKIEEQTRREADERSKRIIGETIQRHASEFVHERTVAVVALPSDDMKGRIIGREGRNIRALEAATGIDLVVDDTPEVVVISCFDPVRREIARIALTRLMADGRIHPARIEEVVEKAALEIEKQCNEAAEQAVFDLGLHRLHPELISLLGKLKFRTSYAQNLLHHSVEVGYLAGLMAGELGLSVKFARRMGLLHDIGHAAGHEMEGSHAAIGAQLTKKFGESPRLSQAIASHHGEVPPQDVMDHLLDAANQLSVERPGARRDQMAGHIQRMESMETICRSFAGIDRVYAILYGREVRVMVDNAKVSDRDSLLMCRDIAKKIETELSFPGPVRVAVIRETRATEYAR